MLKPVLAICISGSLGCLLRWFLGLQLNALFPTIPPGTLAANIIGCYLIGLAIPFLAANPWLSPEWRLFIITGFCGGLTTFSTFSAETVALLQTGQWGWAAGIIGAHLASSLFATLLGFMTYALVSAP